MSSSHEHEHLRWIDRWWPLLVIIYGIIFVGIVTQFNPYI